MDAKRAGYPAPSPHPGGSAHRARAGRSPRLPLARAAFAVAALLSVALLAVGCRVPDRAQWPVQTVLMTPQAEAAAGSEVFENYAQLDGTNVRKVVVAAPELVAKLEARTPADLVLTADPALMIDLARRGWIDPRWRFPLASAGRAPNRPPPATHGAATPVKYAVIQGAVLRAAPDPRGARRLWNYLEQQLRPSE